MHAIPSDIRFLAPTHQAKIMVLETAYIFYIRDYKYVKYNIVTIGSF